MKKGDYFKLVGDYAGVVWTGKRWERFDCQRCVILQEIAKGAPLQGPMTPAAADAMMGPVIHRHDIELHSAYLLRKPGSTEERYMKALEFIGAPRTYGGAGEAYGLVRKFQTIARLALHSK